MASGKMLETVIQIAGELSPTLGKTLEGVNKKLEGVNTKAIAVGAAMGAIAAATAAAVVKAGKYLANLGDEFNMASNNIATETGAAGQELQDLNNIMKDVYANNFGGDMEDVAAGLATVKNTSNLAGEELQKATEAGFALRDTFEYDLSESARAASALMKNFGVDAETAYNLIAVGAQNGADQNGDLLDSLNEYSAQYAALGLNADQFVASLISGNEAGVFSIDKVGDAVKEFNIRSKDMSKTSQEAYQAIGMDAEEMSARFAAGGETAQAALFEVVSSLQDMEDPVEKNAAAVGLFGTMYEDLEQNLLPVLQTMEGAVLDNVDALGQINRVKYNNIGAAMEGIKRQAEVSLLPLATTIANAFMDIAPVIGDLMEDLGPIVEQVTADMMPFVQDFLKGAVGLIKKVMPMISSLAGKLLPLLSTLMENLLPPLLSLAEALLPPLMEIIESLMPSLSSILLTVLPLVTNLASLILPVLVDVINALLPAVQPVLEVLASLLNEVVMPLMPIMVQLIKSFLPPMVQMIGALSPLLSVVFNILSKLMPAISFIAEFVGLIVGFIADIVAMMSDGLVSIISKVASFFGGGSVSVEANANVPAYAAGGFTKGLSIAGEAGTEAVISFDPAYREQNLEYWAKAGRMLGADEPNTYGLSYASTANTVDFGGINFAPVINIDGGSADQQGDVMRALEAEYPEFVDLLEKWWEERTRGAYV